MILCVNAMSVYNYFLVMNPDNNNSLRKRNGDDSRMKEICPVEHNNHRPFQNLFL